MDKIVCLFNIIIEGLILSSFFTVFVFMLNEKIINKIVLKSNQFNLNLLKLFIKNNSNKLLYYSLIYNNNN